MTIFLIRNTILTRNLSSATLSEAGFSYFADYAATSPALFPIFGENKGQMHFCQTTRPITKLGTLTIIFV